MSVDIKAKLKKVIWRSMENDFTIAAFIPTSPGPEFIATGDLFKPSEDILYSLSGEWKDHPKYGKQFSISAYCVEQPCDSDGIVAYLEKYVNGIGPVLADKLVERYGEHTIDILKNSPERIANENKGISYDLAVRISDQLKEDDQRQEILIQLEGLFSKVKGLPKKLANDLLNLYGLTALEVVKSNPYALTDMNRIGFILADKVAMAIGIKKDDPERIKAGILYVIKMIMQETGDIWIDVEKISEILLSMISGISGVDILLWVAYLIKNKELAVFEGLVTLPNYTEDENTIAECVGRFLV